MPRWLVVALWLWLLLLVAGWGQAPTLAQPTPPAQASWNRDVGRRLAPQPRRAERRRFRYDQRQDVPALSPRHLEDTLAAFARSHRARVQTFGSVGDYPLARIDLAARPQAAGRKQPGRRPLRVLITAGLHGDETVGPQVALKLVRQALQDKGLAERFQLTVLPLLNVPGAREDPSGINFNRVFVPGSSSAVVQAIQRTLQGQQYDLVVDLHSSFQPGFFLIRGRDDGGLSRRILGAMERAALLDAPANSPLVNVYQLHCLGGCSTETPGTFKGYMASRATYSYTLEAPRGLPPAQQVRGMYKLLLSALHHTERYGQRL